MFDSIPNVQRGKNDKFHFTIEEEAGCSTNIFVTIPEGGYEIDSIEKFLQNAVLEKHLELLGTFVRGKYYLTKRPNLSMLKVEVTASFPNDFKKKDSIGCLLSFENVTLPAEEK